MRYLLCHPESDCIFEATNTREAQQHCQNGCEDVTGLASFEQLFQLGKSKGRKMGTRVKTRAVNIPAEDPLEDAGLPVSDLPLHVKYRPSKLEHVVGQDAVVKSLQSIMKKATHPHSYLFTGPSGCGKTTFARILASSFGCDPANIIETDAATNTGIDSMREITATLKYKGFGNQPNKMIILDECHALTKQAWQSLLKAVEEPPEHVYFAFCTTDSGKIPETIRTRCSSYDLKSVRRDDLLDLLEFVAEQEKLKVPDSYLDLIANACNGSPRQALVMLPMVDGCEDEDEVARVLETPLESKEIIDLCRLLVSGKLEWRKVQELLKSIPESNAESIRIVVVNYLNACIMGAKSEREVPRLLDILYSFSKPCNPTDKLAPILLAIGEHMFKD